MSSISSMVVCTAALACCFLRQSRTNFSCFKVSSRVWATFLTSVFSGSVRVVFGRMELENRMTVISNQDSVGYMVTISAYQLNMVGGSNVTDACLRGLCNRCRMGR